MNIFGNPLSRWAGIFTCIAMLAGCATQVAQMKAKSSAQVSAAVLEYDNQLVKSGEPFAVLSTQPRSVDRLSAFGPYLLDTLGGRKLKEPAYSFTTTMAARTDLAFSELKVPVGVHDLTIRGGDVRHYVTPLSKVNFESGKRYAIVQMRSTRGKDALYIAEYTPDIRFTAGEADYYVIGARVSDAVELGASGAVVLDRAKP